MRRSVIPLLAILILGCSRADVEVLGRIGQRVEKKIEVVWKSEPNAKLFKSLPLLQQPEGVEHPDHQDGRVPPRLNAQ
jgi:hypothetical protein